VVKLIEFHLGANPSYFRLLYLLDCLMLTGLLIILFLVSYFNFLFIPCGRLSTRQLFTAR